MDDVAALPILLIIHSERHRGGGCKDRCIASKREERLALPKTDVTDPELDCASGTVFGREGILPDTEQKEKRYND